MQMHDLVLIFSFDLLVSNFFLEDDAKLIHKQRGKQNLNTQGHHTQALSLRVDPSTM